MKKINNIIINEKILLQNAILNEERLSTENMYSIYHSHLNTWYKNMDNYLNELVGFDGKTIEEFNAKVENIDFDDIQIENLLQLKNTPLYKKALGEAAFQEVEDLEDLLDVEITVLGNEFYFEGKKVTAFKIADELEEEEQELSKKLYSLLKQNIITEEEWKAYQKNLFYIYEFFVSLTEGELLFVPKISNADYRKMKENEKILHVPFSDQLANLIKENRYVFRNVQRMQYDSYFDNKTVKTKKYFN